MPKELASKRKDIEWKEKLNTGEFASNYSGGKYIDDKGYVRVLNPEHPRNIKGYVYEHRLLMEKYLGRFLQPWETVHHINEIKVDNRVENLFLCTVKEHSAIHKEGRKGTPEQRDRMRKMAKNVKPHTRKKGYTKKSLKEKNFPKLDKNP